MNGIVYHDPSMFAGWPANHGAWQWGSEWLVGFLRGTYAQMSMHNIREPFDYCFARSLDEGRTWSVEPHGAEFDAGVVVHPATYDPLAIRRVCGSYDHGGDHTDPKGGYFLSSDRGRAWTGPYLFTGLEDRFNDTSDECSARQCELDGLVFLSNKDRLQWGSDRVFVARQDAHGFSVVSDIQFGRGRAVMPAVARLNDRLLCAVRRRCSPKPDGWIDAVVSDDEGRTWSEPTLVGDTGGSNGNPPAVIAAHDRFYCCFANRSTRTINVSESRDGIEWSEPWTIAASHNRDMGYPRMLKRQDGSVVAFFYIATKDRPQQHIAWSDINVGS